VVPAATMIAPMAVAVPAAPAATSFAVQFRRVHLFTPFPETKAGLVSPAALHYEATVATMR
jgi:hypothetical protein